MESLFDTILGLPVHPLVVHFAVVILPLATFAIIVSIYWPKFRKQYAFASLVGLVLGTGAAFVAKQSENHWLSELVIHKITQIMEIY